MNNWWRRVPNLAAALPFGWRGQFLLSGEDRLRVERLLALSRLFVAGVALLTIHFDPNEPVEFEPAVYSLLLAYGLFAASIVVLVAVAERFAVTMREAIHVCDIAIVAAITLFSNGPSSPYFIFFIFGMLSAALRWGFRATAATGAAIVVWFALETLIFANLTPEPFDVTRLVFRVAYLMIGTVLLATLAGTQGAFHAERDVLSRMLARVMRSNSFRQTVEDVLSELLDFTGAARAVLAVQQSESGRVYTWTLSAARSRLGGVTLAELTDDTKEDWFFDTAPDPRGWIVTRRGRSVRVRTTASPAAKRAGDHLPRHEAALTRNDAKAYIGLCTETPEWRARVFLFDPTCRHYSDMRLLHHVITQAAPALHGQYMIARLRTTVIEVARARISRELHDRLLQSLIALEMQMEALRRRAETLPSAVRLHLPAIQRQLHEAILDTRDLMTELRPRVSASGILGAVREMVDRFRGDTGIEAALSSEVTDVDASPRISGEIVRIVQEALINIRKHSHASHVRVHFGRKNRSWTLSIEDDGDGFPFAGTQSLTELEHAHRGPIVIEERVRAIGGDMRLRSSPGRGARLEVIWSDARGRAPRESSSHA